MTTSGITSVRSPVTTLQDSVKEIRHEIFVEAMIEAFRDEYGISDQPVSRLFPRPLPLRTSLIWFAFY
jgi:lipoate-protein ligase A